ncbi:MAG: phosphoenolpyruvate--protein phosphotransferase [Verrucomicrobia bacterium]|nr:phosphoenolpyruvate--protein phosphotransferase [Verrucomicrobiota bacterium]
MVGPLDGIAGAPGVVVAVALVLEQGKGSVPRRSILSHEKDAELARFREAVEEAQLQIGEVHGRVADTLPEEHLKILEAYQSMLGDPTLAQAVQDEVVVKGRNAEWAVEVAVQDILRQFDALDDPYLRERRHDVEFVGERLMRALVAAQPLPTAPKLATQTTPLARPIRRATPPLGVIVQAPTVVVARDLSPADTAAMMRDPIVGFVTEVGTRTSHTSIMARALEIPAVVGVSGVVGHVRTGDLVVVDGLRGQVWVRPTPDVTAKARARAERFVSRNQVLRSRHREPAALACGTRISLLANVELPSEATLALEHGAEGIGLYRTEFLYIDRKELPTEDEQYELYRTIAQLAAPRPVTLRTFDLGNDKLATKVPVPDEANPALGTRAVRLALREPELFLVQLRAMARAAAHGDVKVMIPMVSHLDEVRAVRRLMDRALAELAAEGKPHRRPSLGVMIEVPSAAVCADLFAREAEFFSLGTNDLVQYALAADRGSHELARLASSFDPSILRLVRMTVKAAVDGNIPVSVCGAMASDPLAAVLLVGMGVRSLSMEAAAIVEIKEAIRRFSLEECEALATECRALATASEVEMALAESIAPRLSDMLGADDMTIPPPQAW